MQRITIAISLALIACEAGPSIATSGPTVSDSAGVRIVQYAPLAVWDAGVSLTEVLRIGAAEGPPEVLVSRIVGGRILEN